MKTIDYDLALKTLGADQDGFPAGVYRNDNDEHPHEVLEEVDNALRKFGLEVVMITTDSDTYAWFIQKKGV